MSTFWKNKVVVVTGGASGIGLALAKEVSAGGACVVIADLRKEAAEDAASSLPGEAEGARLDVSDCEAFAALVKDLEVRKGGVDVLFNNAGVGLTGEVRDLELLDWQRVMQVNLMGTVHGVQAVYAGMVERGRGQIVNIASIAGLSPAVWSVPYAASKHAVVGLSTSLRAEAAGLGVKVNVACPGLVETPLIREGRAVKIDLQEAFDVVGVPAISPEECARGILRGVERNQGVIVVPWQARFAWVLGRYFPWLIAWLSVSTAEKFRKLRR